MFLIDDLTKLQKLIVTAPLLKLVHVNSYTNLKKMILLSFSKKKSFEYISFSKKKTSKYLDKLKSFSSIFFKIFFKLMISFWTTSYCKLMFFFMNGNQIQYLEVTTLRHQQRALNSSDKFLCFKKQFHKRTSFLYQIFIIFSRVPLLWTSF